MSPHRPATRRPPGAHTTIVRVSHLAALMRLCAGTCPGSARSGRSGRARPIYPKNFADSVIRRSACRVVVGDGGLYDVVRLFSITAVGMSAKADCRWGSLTMSASQPLSTQGNGERTERIRKSVPAGLALGDTVPRWSALMLGGEAYEIALSRHGWHVMAHAPGQENAGSNISEGIDECSI